MTRHPIRAGNSRNLRIVEMLVALALVACCSAPPANGANQIAGSVRNQTLGRPAAADEVILLQVDQKISEVARAKTDARGAFAFKVQNSGKPYLVRVLHQNVNYDQQASAGDTLSIDVYDAAPQVRGITASIEILRTGTNGKLLHVSDMVEIQNQSSPPLTRTGARTFEVYLPRNAKLDSVFAAGPGKIGEQISAVPVPGDPGHYTVNFPLRPGATRFAFNYDLPYDGHAQFQTKHDYPLQQLAVMIPPTMTFSSSSPAFQPLAAGNSRYNVQAANQLAAGEGPAFEISGAGTLPALKDPSQTQTAASLAIAPAPAVSAPRRDVALASVTAVASAAQSGTPSQPLLLAILTAVLVAVCAILMWRVSKTRQPASARSSPRRNEQRPQPTILLEGLKKELFQLEEDKQSGAISGTEYASTRQALDETVKRALAKAG